MPKPGVEDEDSKNLEDEESQNQGDDTSGSSDNSGEETDIDVDDDGDEDTDDPTELKEQLRKTKESKDLIYGRMKKAQGYVEKKDAAGKVVRDDKGRIVWEKKSNSNLKPPERKDNTQQQASTFSEDDLFAFVDNGVRNKDDRDMVKRYAKANDMTITEALGEDTVKTTLANRAEERKTSNATHTDRTRRTTGKQSPESLLSKATNDGELPDSDEDMTKLAEQRWKNR